MWPLWQIPVTTSTNFVQTSTCFAKHMYSDGESAWKARQWLMVEPGSDATYFFFIHQPPRHALPLSARDQVSPISPSSDPSSASLMEKDIIQRWQKWMNLRSFLFPQSSMVALNIKICVNISSMKSLKGVHIHRLGLKQKSREIFKFIFQYCLCLVSFHPRSLIPWQKRLRLSLNVYLVERSYIFYF